MRSASDSPNCQHDASSPRSSRSLAVIVNSLYSRVVAQRDLPSEPACRTVGACPRHLILLSFRFLCTATVESLVNALVALFTPAQLAVLSALISILGGLFVGYVAQEEAGTDGVPR